MIYRFYDYKCKCKNCRKDFVLEHQHKPPCFIPVDCVDISKCTAHEPPNYCAICFSSVNEKHFFIPECKYSLCDKCKANILPSASGLEELENLYTDRREQLRKYEFCENDDMEMTESTWTSFQENEIIKGESKMTDCENLHDILKQGKSFDFKSDIAIMTKHAVLPVVSTICENGVYILYEKGEKGHNGDRIVRIGIHIGKDQLGHRINQHFKLENKDRSIFRKNIGRAFLNKKNDPYLEIWNETRSPRADKDFEKTLEKEISKYMQDNFYFKLIAIDRKDKRLELEKKLIGTVSNCRVCKASKNWLGNYSPLLRIKTSGLWQVQGLYGQGLSESDFDFIENNLLK